MKKTRKLLGLCTALVMLLAMGSVVYAATYSGEVLVQDLKEGDLLEKGAKIVGGPDDYITTLIIDGVTTTTNYSIEYQLQTTLEVTKTDRTVHESGPKYWSITLDSPSSNPSDEGGQSSEPRLSAEERWKNSPQNPDNYLPKYKLADGTEVRATFPAHYSAGKDDSVSAVITTMEDFNRILGIPGGKTVHMKSWYSLCGEKMKKLMADYAALLGEQCSAEVTLGEIIELETEIRDTDYKLLGLAEESEQPVQITICIQGKLRELADTMDFAVVMWTDGETVVLKDIDEEPGTITFETTRTNGVIGIFYAPKGSFAGLE